MTSCRTFFLVLQVIFLATSSLAQEVVVISGAGPSTAVVSEFFDLLARQPGCQEYRFVVPERSIKHSGGINASDTNVFGRTGRPLNSAERGDSREEIILARIPLTFVIDPDLGIVSLSIAQLRALLLGEITNWKELGGPDVPVKLVGREPTEAVLTALAQTIPEIQKATFELRLTRDHQLAQMMETEDREGVLSFGASSNFSSDKHIFVEGLDIGLAMGLVYNRANAQNALVQYARDFVETELWRGRVVELGFHPAVAGSKDR